VLCSAFLSLSRLRPLRLPRGREHDSSMANASRSAAVVPSLIGRSLYEMVQDAPASHSSAAGKSSSGSGSSCGVFALRWSHDGRFIASSVLESSRVLWVWDMTSLVCVAQLQNLAAFVDFQWCPRTNQLAAACGSRTVYVWTEEGQS
jgi:WD40 repeat protein